MPESVRVRPPIPPKQAFIVIDGRRWRATDPGIPENLRQELVNELMAARRAVRDAANDRELRRSRKRVNDAKVALGERGRGWWLPPTPAATTVRIDAAISTLLRSRPVGRSIGPGEIARIVGGSAWRRLLTLVRARAAAMSEVGGLEILRGGVAVEGPVSAGALRYRRNSAAGS